MGDNVTLPFFIGNYSFDVRFTGCELEFIFYYFLKQRIAKNSELYYLFLYVL